MTFAAEKKPTTDSQTMFINQTNFPDYLVISRHLFLKSNQLTFSARRKKKKKDFQINSTDLSYLWEQVTESLVIEIEGTALGRELSFLMRGDNTGST